MLTDFSRKGHNKTTGSMRHRFCPWMHAGTSPACGRTASQQQQIGPPSLIDATHTVLEDPGQVHEDLVARFSASDNTPVEYFMRRYWRCGLLSGTALPTSANIRDPRPKHETVEERRVCTVTTRVLDVFLQTYWVAERSSRLCEYSWGGGLRLYGHAGLFVIS